jgi:uncharacterized protein (TIGR00251 family)
VRLLLKVVPKSSRDRISGWVGDRLKVTVTTAPERGRANAAVLELLEAALGVRVRLVSGGAGPLKAVEVEAEEAEVLSRLPPR